MVCITYKITSFLCSVIKDNVLFAVLEKRLHSPALLWLGAVLVHWCMRAFVHQKTESQHKSHPHVEVQKVRTTLPTIHLHKYTITNVKTGGRLRNFSEYLNAQNREKQAKGALMLINYYLLGEINVYDRQRCFFKCSSDIQIDLPVMAILLQLVLTMYAKNRKWQNLYKRLVYSL